MEKMDFSQTIRPFALLEIANCLKRLLPGKEMEFIGLDNDTIRDLKYILPHHCHSIQMHNSKASLGQVVIRIKKDK